MTITPVPAPAPAPAEAAEDTTLTLQRITATVDPLAVTDAKLTATLQPFRVEAITQIYTGIHLIQGTLTQLNGLLSCLGRHLSLRGVLPAGRASA
jgi:hypothetical protein